MNTKLSSKELRSIENFVKKKLKNADPAHDFDHVKNVVRLASLIGKEEGANFRILIPAAYFHDIVRKGKHHEKKSAELAEKFLRKIGFSEPEIRKIKEAIIESSWESFKKGINPKSLEGKVLRDADWLEALGARGIARVFAFGGCLKRRIGKVKWNPENPVRLKSRFPDPSSIYHFFSKLLWLKNGIQTKLGKRLAKQRHEFMVRFLKRYKKEWEGKL